jgi:hypothetical protein
MFYDIDQLTPRDKELNSMQKKVWHKVANHPEIRVGQYIVPNFVSNSVLIRASKSDLVVVSPGKALLDSLQEELESTDKSTDKKTDVCMHIIMPNSFHYMGVKAWQETFPKHRLYASRGAIKTLVEKGVANSPEEITPLETEQPPLPFNYSILFPPGHRGHDVWIKKFDKESEKSLWITCDSFLNYDRMSNQPVAKAMQKVLGAAPGLKMSQVIKWFILDNKSAFKNWALKQIANDQPTVLIPSHGEVLESESLGQQLSTLLNERL